MSQEISLFSGYNQGENRTTNYCGLMLRLLYEKDITAFEETLITLCGDAAITVGPTFQQQKRKRDSVPDMLIEQTNFSVWFETKNGGTFSNDQVQRHLQGLSGSKKSSENIGTNVLILLSKESPSESQIAPLKKQAQEDGILLTALTFEEFVTTLEDLHIGGYFVGYLEEFKTYLDSNDLLPQWKHRLDVVNCGKSMHELEAGAYMCPATGGPYSHRKSRFIGAYQGKQVRKIYELDAVVEFDTGANNAEITYKIVEQPDDSLKERARTILGKYREGDLQEKPMQVFLLSAESETSFEKDSKGGLINSKIYFDVPKEIETSKELAAYLKDKTWSEISLAALGG